MFARYITLDARESARKKDHLKVLAVGILILATAATVGTFDSAWVAKGQAQFARALASQGITLGSAELSWMADAIEPGCEARRGKRRKLSEVRREQLDLYLRHYCEPWMSWWNSILEPCLSGGPDWCSDTAATFERLNVGGYFRTLYSELHEASGDLEKHNIMLVMVSAFDAHVMNDVPREAWESWLDRTIHEYLSAATPSRVAEVAERLSQVWVGVPKTTRDQLLAYADTTGRDSESARQRILDALEVPE